MRAYRTPREADYLVAQSSRAQTCLKDRSSLAKLGDLPAVILVRDQLNALGSLDARMNTGA
jgi:hypothetical protein